MIRGIERKPIFADDQDRDALMDRLVLVLPETQTACYAWVFMENHAHFLFRSSPAGISHIMRRLMTGYAGYFNRRHVRHGLCSKTVSNPCSARKTPISRSWFGTST
ncbi:transposase [Desulfatibacillum aliphaticivorans]|uniref:transposase n=1 Tax=Desulfatibacillum aliphaticivorans TaxID=218208 RepID=UPI001D053D6F|nr:transposase [Desulfatibacillum aliphaticivorans]